MLSVTNLSVSFVQYKRWIQRTSLLAVRDVSLTVKERELVAVIGSSGSGKSLLAHAVLGILPYNASWSGEISYYGEKLTEKRMEELRGREIVLVPQSVSYLDPLMKAGTQLRKGKRDRKSKEESLRILGRYGLDETVEKLYPFELSGGMTRRILISTAVMEKPELVIADEPTPGIHPEAAKRVLSHFREIADEGAGVLLITHDLEQALHVADRIVVFYGGSSIEEASAADFKEERFLRHPYSRALYRAMPEHGFEAPRGVRACGENHWSGCPYAGGCELREARCFKKVEYVGMNGGMVRCVKAEERNGETGSKKHLIPV